jgi:guanylate kinase
LFVISAASGSGKSSLVDGVIGRLERTARVVTCTTRAPRGAERDGVDYHFLSVEEFERRIAAGDFLEHARVHGDRLYGTSRSSVTAELERGIDLFLVIDVQGAEQVRKRMPEAVTVFIMPPSAEELEARLRRRCAEENHADEADVAVRLATARAEVPRYDEFSYVIVNDDFSQAVDELASIVTAERCRIARKRSRLLDILRSFGVESLHA